LRTAVVSAETNVVINVVVADASGDVAPDGCFLVDVDNFVCAIGWVYDQIVNDFSDPNPPDPSPVEEVVNGN